MATSISAAACFSVCAAAPARAGRTRATLRSPSGRQQQKLRSLALRTRAAATTPNVDSETGIKKVRDGIKEAAAENILTPR